MAVSSVRCQALWESMHQSDEWCAAIAAGWTEVNEKRMGRDLWQARAAFARSRSNRSFSYDDCKPAIVLFSDHLNRNFCLEFLTKYLKFVVVKNLIEFKCSFSFILLLFVLQKIIERVIILRNENISEQRRVFYEIHRIDTINVKYARLIVKCVFS